MERRAFLTGVAGLSTVPLAGCASRLPELSVGGPHTTAFPVPGADQINMVRFESDVDGVDPDVAVRGRGEVSPPDIYPDYDDTVVVVEGAILIGGSNCNRPGLRELEFSQQDQQLRVVVSDERVQNEPDWCHVDLAGVAYRATIFLEGTPSFELVVTEIGTQGNTAEARASIS